MPVLIGYLLGILLGSPFGLTGLEADFHAAKYQAIFGCIGAVVGYIVDFEILQSKFDDKIPKSLCNPWVYVTVVVITGVVLGQKLGVYCLLYGYEDVAKKYGPIIAGFEMIIDSFSSREAEYGRIGAFGGGLVAFAVSMGRVFYRKTNSPGVIKTKDSVSWR